MVSFIYLSVHVTYYTEFSVQLFFSINSLLWDHTLDIKHHVHSWPLLCQIKNFPDGETNGGLITPTQEPAHESDISSVCVTSYPDLHVLQYCK